MSIYESTALGQFLSHWPDNLSYEQVLDVILEGDCNDNDIDIYDYYYGVDEAWLCEQIENLRATLERNFLPRGA